MRAVVGEGDNAVSSSKVPSAFRPTPAHCALTKKPRDRTGCTRVKGNEIAWNETIGRLQTEEEADLADLDCEGKVLGGLRPTSTLSSMARYVVCYYYYYY